MRLIILFLFIGIASICKTQGTFNKRVSYGFEAFAFTGIVATDSCYFLTGIAVDSAYPYALGSYLSKFNLEGNRLFLNYYKDLPSGSFQTWEPVLEIDNNILYNVGLLGFSESMALPVLISYNLDGDINIFRTYTSVTGDTTWSAGRDFLKYDENINYILVMDLINYTYYNFSLIKTNKDGKKIWHRLPYLPPDSIGVKPSSFIKDKDGSLLVLAKYSNEDFVRKGFISQDILLRLDTSGFVLETWISPENRLQGRILSGLIQTQDEGYAFTSGLGAEIGSSLDPYHLLFYNGGICKLNNDLEEEWFVHFGDSQNAGYYTFLRNLIELDDGSIVAAGNYFDTLPEPVMIEGYDYPDYYNINGWLLKVSSTGNIIWSRQFNFVNSPGDQHRVFDFKVTSDSGFILCGDAIDYYNLTPPPMQGWLIKTDKYGCIVPGCHLGIEGNTVKNHEIKIYPNPARDYVNIYFCTRESKQIFSAKGRLVDMSGNILLEFDMWQSDVTYILPVSNFRSGIYIFQYILQNKIEYSSKMLIMK